PELRAASLADQAEPAPSPKGPAEISTSDPWRAPGVSGLSRSTRPGAGGPLRPRGPGSLARRSHPVPPPRDLRPCRSWRFIGDFRPRFRRLVLSFLILAVVHESTPRVDLLKGLSP